jgi:bacterial/archaeal transporter family-2 protein
MFDWRLAAWSLAAGAGIPVMAVLNARLGRALGEPLHAAVLLFCVAFIFVAAVALGFTGKLPSLSLLADTPKINLIGGVFVGIYVISATFLAPRFGVGNFILFAMVAQISVAAAIDHLGLFGAAVREVGWLRLLGIAVMIAGLAIAQVAAGAKR